MVEFIQTRTRLQWFVALAWALLVGVIAYEDVKIDKTVTAVGETIIYVALFVAAATLGHFSRR